MVLKGNLLDLSYFKIWLLENRMLAESSVYEYCSIVERFLVTDPVLDEVDDYNTFLIKGSVKKRCTHYYSALKVFIEYKIENIGLRSRLISNLVKPRINHNILRERKHLDEVVLFEIVNHLSTEKHKVMALIQALSGVRAGDILRMKRGTIVEEELRGTQVLRLNILGKGKKRNVVYIFDDLTRNLVLDYIDTNYNHGDYYFIELGDRKGREGNINSEYRMYRMNYMWYWGDLKTALNTCKIDKEDFSTHDFRRCFARRVWEKWHDIYKLQKALNHADPKVTMRYLEQSGLQAADIHYEMQNPS